MALTDDLVSHYPMAVDGSDTVGGPALQFDAPVGGPRFLTMDLIGAPTNLPGYWTPQFATFDAPAVPQDGTRILPTLYTWGGGPTGLWHPQITGWTRSAWFKNGGQASPNPSIFNTVAMAVGVTDNHDPTGNQYGTGYSAIGLSGSATPLGVTFSEGNLIDFALSSVTESPGGGWHLVTALYVPIGHPLHNLSAGDEVHIAIDGVRTGNYTVVSDTNSTTLVDGKVDGPLNIPDFNAATGLSLTEGNRPQWIDLAGLGWGPGNDNFWGMCQEANWSRVLSDAELLQLWNGGAGTVLGGAPPNVPPQIDNPIPDQAAQETVPFSFTTAVNVASDPDNQPVTPLQVSAVGGGGGPLPSWITGAVDQGNGTIQLTGTPGIGDAGTDTVRVIYDDGADTVFDEFDIVIAAAPNQVPQIDNPIPDQTAYENIEFDFTTAANVASDPDGGPVSPMTVSAELVGGGPLPDWLSAVDQGNQTIRFTGEPTLADLGTVSIRVTYDDGEDTVFDDFDINVLDFMQPPANPNTPSTGFSSGSNTIPFTAGEDYPAGAVEVFGQFVGVIGRATKTGEIANLRITGAKKITKAVPADVFAFGDKVYVNAVTKTATTNPADVFAGHCIQASENGDTLVNTRLSQ